MKHFKKLTALVLAMVMAFSMTACSPGVGLEDDGTQTAIVEGINGAGEFLVKKITSPTYGDETAIIALNRSTYIDYWHNRSTLYESGLDHVVKSNGYVLGNNGEVYVDGYDDVILAHTAVGILADKASSNNFMEGISFDSVVMEGGYLNKVQALIALECGKYAMYEKGDLTREDLIDFTMGLRQQDGSFDYKGMDDVTPVKITATAVTALALTGEAEKNTEIATAIADGVDYLKGHIRETDSIDDITSTIIALNTTGETAMDVEGKDLTEWLLVYQTKDGAFSTADQAKKGDIKDTAVIMLGLASQYRFNTGMTSIYDMSDVLGGTHNKLSPEWNANMKLLTYFIYFLVVFMIGLFIVSRLRLRRWKKMNLWDESANRLRDEVSTETLLEYDAKYKASKGKEYPVYVTLAERERAAAEAVAKTDPTDAQQEETEE